MLAAMRPVPTPWRGSATESARRSGRRCGLAAIPVAALLAACSFEYSGAGASASQLLEYVPETEFTDVTHTIVRNGRVAAELHAVRVRNFAGGRSELEAVSYWEYGPNGTLVAAGSAERAVYHARREDAELAGAIRLRSQSQGVWLEAETLRWEHQRRRLTTSPEETVAIVRDDGSEVAGTGLEVDVRRKTIRFSGPVSGSLVAETDAAD